MTSQESATAGSTAKEAALLGSCCAALGTLIPVALYQTGILDRLPDPPSPIFASERITRSQAAHPLGIPDALIGLASFGTTLTLILLAKKHIAARRLLGAKLVVDASAAAFNATRQIVSFGRLCSWCTGTAVATGIMAYSGRETIQGAWADAVCLLKQQQKLPSSLEQ